MVALPPPPHFEKCPAAIMPTSSHVFMVWRFTSPVVTTYKATYVLCVCVQKKVMDEIDEILGTDAERRFTMKDLNNMKYLECCIKEALRLYPSVPVIARRINEDVNIGKFNTR
jgi:ABC-type ATPase with predicted acetyltransferase domain